MKTLLLITIFFVGFTTFGQTDEQRKEAAEYITRFLNNRNSMTQNEGYLKYYSFDESIELYSNTKGVHPMNNELVFEVNVKQTIKLSDIKSIDFNHTILDNNLIILNVYINTYSKSYKEVNSFKKDKLPETKGTYTNSFDFYNQKPMTDEETKKFALAVKLLFNI